MVSTANGADGHRILTSLQTLCRFFWSNINWSGLSPAEEASCTPCQVNPNTAKFTIRNFCTLCLKGRMATEPGCSDPWCYPLSVGLEQGDTPRLQTSSASECWCYTAKNCSALPRLGNQTPLQFSTLPCYWSVIKFLMLILKDFYTQFLIIFKGIIKSLVWMT